MAGFVLVCSVGTHCAAASEAIIHDLRIGFLAATGDVLWPVEEPDEPAIRFTDDGRWKERDNRRRQWMKQAEDDPEALANAEFRLTVGATVTVLHDGRATRAMVDGLEWLDAGCGEKEPVWRASTTGLHARAPWPEERWDRSRPATPVLIDLGGGQAIEPPTMATDAELPAGLLKELAARDLLERENRSLRLGPLWVVYSARLTDAKGRLVGSVRTIWRASAGSFRLLDSAASSATYEEMVTKWHDPQRHALSHNSGVGQVHALLAHDSRLFLLVRRVGWESSTVLLQELREGVLETVLIDAFDRGC